MAVKKRKCKYHGTFTETFIQVPAGVFCTRDAAYLFARGKQEKEQARLIAKLKRSQISNHKAERKAHKEAKERIKPKSKWLSELQAIVNKCVRLRDTNLGCVSCDKNTNWDGQWHAGHYYSRGHSSSLRFNLHNIHKQCSVCNNYLSGNIGEYTSELINRIGQDKFDYLLANKSKVASYDVEWIKRAIKVARKGVKRYEKRLN